MKHKLLDYFESRKRNGLKSLAVLVDPEKISGLDKLIALCIETPPDVFLIGGSFTGETNLIHCIEKLRSVPGVPIILFPGNINQVVSEADGILLLSVISSRNSELLIGKHVEASFRIKQSGIEVLPTGYMLIESGRLTTVQYMSQSVPLPRTKPELAAATALAGEQLGQSIIYLEAGSGAEEVVPEAIIAGVCSAVQSVVFTGGGITTGTEMSTCFKAGSDVVVVGNILEIDPTRLRDFILTRDFHNP